MTKADIASRVATKLQTSQKEASNLVELVLDIMKNTLEPGEKIKIAGFGNFVVKQKADRRGRNPQTGEDIVIKSRQILTFKPSNVLRDSVNKR